MENSLTIGEQKQQHIQRSGPEQRTAWSIYTEGGDNKRGTGVAIRKEDLV